MIVNAGIRLVPHSPPRGQDGNVADSTCSTHDLGQSKLVKSLVAEGVVIGDWTFEPVLFDNAVERLIVESVVSRWKRQVFTNSSQLALQFLQIAPQEEERLSELTENSGLSFQATMKLVINQR